MGLQAAMILNSIVNFYCVLIFIWAILSWFKNSSKVVQDIYRVLDSVVAPYVNIFRKILPPMGGVDFSPFIALIVLQIVARLVVNFLA